MGSMWVKVSYRLRIVSNIVENYYCTGFLWKKIRMREELCVDETKHAMVSSSSSKMDLRSGRLLHNDDAFGR